MKKLLLLSALAMMNVATFAGTNAKNNSQCTAHYYLTVMDGDHAIVTLNVNIVGSTCAAAMADAKSIAYQMAALY